MARITKDGFLITDNERIDLKCCYLVKLVGNNVYIKHKPPSEKVSDVDIYIIDGDAQYQWKEAFRPDDHT